MSCPWKNPASATQQVRDIMRFREQSNPVLRDRFIGVVQTVWSGADGFLDNFQRFAEDDSRTPDEKSEAACLVRVLEEISELSRPNRP